MQSTKSQTEVSDSHESKRTAKITVYFINCLHSKLSLAVSGLAYPPYLGALRFRNWCTNRPWLMFKNERIICSFCEDIKDLSSFLKKGECLRIDSTFINGLDGSQLSLKKLNDKISDHGKAKSHKLCESIISQRQKKAVEQSMICSQSLFIKQNQEKVNITAKAIRTAYFIAKENLSFSLHKSLTELQVLNGIDMGNLY